MIIDSKDLISYKELKPGSLIECYYLEREQRHFRHPKKIHVEQTRDFFYNDTHHSCYLCECEGRFPLYIFLKVEYWKGKKHLLVYSLTHKKTGWIPVNDTLIIKPAKHNK